MKAKIINLNLRRFVSMRELSRAINNTSSAFNYCRKWRFTNSARAHERGYMFTSYTSYEKNTRLIFGE